MTNIAIQKTVTMRKQTK